MNISPDGLLALKSDEGLRLVPYNDKATEADRNPASGNATVGYGHLLHRGPLNGTEVPITYAQALQLLVQDVHDKAEVYVNKITAPLNQNQYDALCIFCYNVGDEDLETVVKETGLNQGNYSTVAPKILLYNKSRNAQGILVALPGLTTRRQREAVMFNCPVEDPTINNISN